MNVTTHPLRTERLRRGLTLRKLADQCREAGTPVSFGQLGQIERGNHTPHPALRKTLAEILDLDVTDFEREAS